MKNREEREKKYFNNDFQPTNAFMQEEDENFDDLYDKVSSSISAYSAIVLQCYCGLVFKVSEFLFVTYE